MKIQCIQSEKKYIRIIESMGDGLILFKICAAKKRLGQNLHLFFEDKRKPPLDIAINPDNRTIEYISYFAQDENIDLYTITNNINYKFGLVTIRDDFSNQTNNNQCFTEKFKIIKSNDNIFILSEGLSCEPLNAYKLNNFNYLLFSKDFAFAGILLKNISEKELNEIQTSHCLQY